MRTTILLAVLLLAPLLARGADLGKGFASPPDSARPWAWWMWLHGNVSAEGITADLDAMHRAGVRGALMMMPTMAAKGPVIFNSPQWYGLIRHAANEASQRGMELGIHNCEGWSSSGGPWVGPELAMQMLVWSERRIRGPTSLAESLPMPLTRRGYYRDIAAFAFPTPSSETRRLALMNPKVTGADGKPIEAAALFDGNFESSVELKNLPQENRCAIQFECDRPLATGRLLLVGGPGAKGVRTELQRSDDGTNFTTVRRFNVNYVHAITDWLTSIPLDGVESRFFRLVFESKTMPLVEVDMWAKPAGASTDAIAPASLVNLTDKLGADGRLSWQAPPGDWTILRIGHTAIGKENHPASAEGVGLEVDKLSREAFKVHFDALMGKVIAEMGPLAGKALVYGHVDSYEIGPQNWTPRFPQEFKAARGYDVTRWLPALTGRNVESAALSDRFRFDFRRTIGDLWARNYYGYFGELLHERGLKLCGECYGVFTADDIACAGKTDMPVTEFWLPGDLSTRVKWSAAMAAHLHGRPVVAAEAFTSNDDGWEYDPFSMKALGDVQFCSGVNRFIVHNFTSQPELDRKPGLSWPNGVYYNRNNTWWEPGRAWADYVSRCQYLLQQGHFVADVLSLATEDVSRFDLDGRVQRAPEGYDYDGCDWETLLERVSVREGRLTLPHGPSYALLALPNTAAMTAKAARRINELVEAGATVVGPRPGGSPSLSDRGAGADELARIVAKLWGGEGQCVAGRTIEDGLAKLGLKRDFEYTPATARLNCLHRRAADADIYLVANSVGRAEAVECVFRVSGKVPELWHPDTGRIETAAGWRVTADGRTWVPLLLDPAGSVFVVFRKPATGSDPLVSVTCNGMPLVRPKTGRLEIVSAAWGDLRQPAGMMDVTASARALVKDDRLSLRNHKPFAERFTGAGNTRGLKLVYAVNGEQRTSIVKNPLPIELPDEVVEPASAEWDGARWIAWQPGHYEFVHASGRIVRKEVPTVPAPQTIAGPWEAVFDPKCGGPGPVMLAALCDWTAHDDPRIRFYSGTVTYRTSFDLPETAGPLFLDLGEVRNLAEVTVNGGAPQVLWKPPFRMDITTDARRGKNELCVRVTNLWANRLIGDAAQPPERRMAQISTHPYRAGMPLFSSGLLGPVRVLEAREVR